MRFIKIAPDGNCLFSAFAIALANRNFPERERTRRANILRSRVSKYIRRSSTFDDALLGMPKDGYAAALATPGVWGGGPELSALAVLFDARVVVVDIGAGTAYEAARSDRIKKTVVLAYTNDCHYDAVIA